jgi:putative DNA primase/helicase
MDPKLKKLLEEREKLEAQIANTEIERSKIEFPYTKTKSVGNNETIEIPVTAKENTQALLDHFKIDTKYNEMTKKIELDFVDQEFTADIQENVKLTELRDRARKNALPITDLAEHVDLLATAYHPVRDFIESKPWDGISRLENMYDTIKTDNAMKEVLLRKWFVSAVAVLYSERGCRCEGVLVFEGSQGTGKTSWVKSIVPDKEWVKEGVSLDPKNKDTVIEALSSWMTELGELGAIFRKADVDNLKAFLTKDRDNYRPPYAAKVNEYSRRTVFFATVDSGRFLVDQGGNRRFWSINVSEINCNHGIDLQQFWAEVKAIFDAGEQHWLTPDEINGLNGENENFMVLDPVQEMMSSWDIRSFDESHAGPVFIGNTTSILLEIGVKNPTRHQLIQCGAYLRKNNIQLHNKAKRTYKVNLDEPVGSVRGVSMIEEVRRLRAL